MDGVTVVVLGEGAGDLGGSAESRANKFLTSDSRTSG